MSITRRSFALVALTLPALPLLADGKKGEAVKKVEPQFVCMINKKSFAKAQTSVVVGEKVYYSCCDGCTDKLKNDAKSRMDIDPVSGKEVDKSGATIGKDKAGNVYFFENMENLRQFRTK